jgi:hypothetical protein
LFVTKHLRFRHKHACHALIRPPSRAQQEEFLSVSEGRTHPRREPQGLQLLWRQLWWRHPAVHVEGLERRPQCWTQWEVLRGWRNVALSDDVTLPCLQGQQVGCASCSGKKAGPSTILTQNVHLEWQNGQAAINRPSSTQRHNKCVPTLPSHA